jgi:hypothetical protein
MTQHPDLFAALAAPFDASEVKVRSAGPRQVHYITARTAMNRLDDVLGPENWWDEYVPGENSVLCRLTIRLPDGTTLTKADAGGYAGMSDEGDDDKSGYSDAFKRAAVKFGVARYLYRDGVPTFVQGRAAGPDGGRSAPPPPPTNGHHRERHDWPTAHPNATSPPPAPRTGKALFAWAKGQGGRLLKYLTAWGNRHDFPSRMIDWSKDQVAEAYAEAVRKLGEAIAS